MTHYIPSNTPSLLGPQHDIPESVDAKLVNILSWPRKHQSPDELLFRTWLDDEIKVLGCTVQLLQAGVRMVTVGTSRTLFSCHIDTCDTDTTKGERKMLTYDSNFGHIALDRANKVGSCLGADDGAGLWLMLKMIEAKVAGTYVFHTGEECGGVGAKAVTSQINESTFKGKFDRCVAFDRPRDNEIITTQGGSRTCSDTFASALVSQLNAQGMDYHISPHGTYTDSKEYRGLVPECTNVGVGYQNQHGPSEFQDYAHLFALLGALLKVKWEKLPVVRKAEIEVPATWSGQRSVFNNSFAFDKYNESRADKARREDKKPKVEPKKKSKELNYSPLDSVMEDLMLGNIEDIAFIIDAEPDVAKDTIIKLAMEVASLRGQNAFLRKMVGEAR